MAEFNCTSDVAHFLSWRVNGSELNKLVISNQGILRKSFFPEAGVTGSRLIIPTMRATSSTTVVCIAIFPNGNTTTVQETCTANLIVQGEYIQGTMFVP